MSDVRNALMFKDTILKNSRKKQSSIYNRSRDFNQVINLPRNLLHITDCVREFGSVNSFSAYRFENFMSQINRLVRGKRNVIQQLHNRVEEMHKLDLKFADSNSADGWEFRANDRDCYVGLVDSRLGKIIGIKHNIYSIKVFSNVTSFFDHPIDSRRVGVFQASHLSDTLECSLEDIAHKYYCFSHDSQFVLVRLL